MAILMSGFHPVGRGMRGKLPPPQKREGGERKKERREKKKREGGREGKRQRSLIFTPLVAAAKSIRNMTHAKCHSHFHTKRKFLDETLNVIKSGIVIDRRKHQIRINDTTIYKVHEIYVNPNPNPNHTLLPYVLLFRVLYRLRCRLSVLIL